MRLIVVTAEHSVQDEAYLLKEMLSSGNETVHVRKPGFSKAELCLFLDQFSERELGQMVIHRELELIKEFPLKGIHLSEAQRINSGYKRVSEKSFSTSFHSADAIENTENTFDYCFIGPLFNSFSKAGYIASEKQLIPSQKKFPLIAIGGIGSDTIAKVSEQFDGIAVCGSVWFSNDPLCSFNLIKAICNKKQFEYGRA